MANPQLEDGHVRIANEILEALLKANLTGAEWTVLMFIFRKTYGWQKKEDEISLSQFVKALPLSRRGICKALNHLRLVNIIALVHKGSSVNSSNVYMINKNYETWQLVNQSTLVHKQVKTSAQTGMQLVNQSAHTKETITKEILQKKVLSNFEKFWESYPIKKSKKKAFSIFQKIGEENFEKIFKAIEDQKKEREVFAKTGQFFPEWKHPTTWLNQECWNDEVIQPDKDKTISIEEQNRIAAENLRKEFEQDNF